jgi:hypothetical protein
MKKRIRSISISEIMDDKLKEDSNYRGLTISANLSRILYEYFQNQPNQSGIRLSVKNK